LSAASIRPSDPPQSKRKPLILLAGNPNTGKTTVFNALCGTRQKVGNFPGVTVEKKSGLVDLGNGSAEVVDLPGLYSLDPLSPDEEVASEGIRACVPGMAGADLLVFVMDATNIKRNLYLLSQVADCQRPVLVVLTMVDLLDREGIELDANKLEQAIALPLVCFDGRTAQGLQELKTAMQRALDNPQISQPGTPLPQPALLAVQTLQQAHPGLCRLDALELLADRGKSNHSAKAVELARDLAGDLPEQSRPNPATTAIWRYQWADRVVAACERRLSTAPSLSMRIDRWLLHRFWGLLFFLAIMVLMFQTIYQWAVPFMDAIEGAFSFMGARLGAALESMPLLRSLAVDGVLAGVGSVLVFLPQIVLLFLFVAILEDSGYLARAAFLMDKLLGWTGLNGRAFIPLLSSFACAVPGIMAARVMPDPKARMATILVAPLMSCSARLPIYILLISAFIEPQFGPGVAAMTLFAMHALGLLLALAVAFLLNRGVLRTPAMPFIMEMPAYRRPLAYNVLLRAYDAGKRFTLRAGTVIFAFSIVIWVLSTFPRPREVETQLRLQETARGAALDGPEWERNLQGAYLEQSWLGRMGKAIQPAFAPLGFDWRITVGILSAFPAREVILSTFGIIYRSGDEEAATSLKSRMAEEQWPDGRPVFTPLTAVVLMIFFALCSQCMSTLATVQRELNSWKWAGFLFFYMTALAYLVSMATYQVGRWWLAP